MFDERLVTVTVLLVDQGHQKFEAIKTFPFRFSRVRVLATSGFFLKKYSPRRT